mgnify:CR=1 FL=1
MKFTIPGELPSLNEIIKASKSHPMAYANMKKDYTALVMIHAQKLSKVVEKANFEITWYCKNKRKDKDNIMVGQKFIFDGLIKAGVLKNDGWNEVGNISHFFRIDKENPRVEVKLWNYNN